MWLLLITILDSARRYLFWIGSATLGSNSIKEHSPEFQFPFFDSPNRMGTWPNGRELVATSNGTTLQQWEWRGLDSQKWRLKKIAVAGER
jgi:hypothetical protein